MKVKRKPGVVRRPIEYFLSSLILILAVALLSFTYLTKQANQKITFQPIQPYAPNGTVKEMAVISDIDITGEKNINNNIHRAENSVYESLDSEFGKLMNSFDYEQADLSSCELIRSSTQRSLSSLKDKVNNLDAELASDIEKNKDKRLKQDESIASWRAKQDITRSDSYGLINQKFLGHLDPSYSEKIDTQVTVRRSAFDVARTNFRNQVDQVLLSKHSQTKTDVQQLIDELDLSIAKTNSACTEVDRPQVLVELETSLDNTRSAYSLKIQTTYADVLNIEILEFKEVIKLAIADFERASTETMSEFSYLDR